MFHRSVVCHRARVEALETRVLLSASYVVTDVQPAALDQPRVHVLFRTDPNGPPLTATDPILGGTSFDVQAFLDTGTSGNLLSQETWSALGINPASYNGQEILYSDVGVGGATVYNVSGPLYPNIANFSPVIDGTDETTFTQKSGPFNLELNPTPVADPTLEDPIDIVGMPVMQGKVMVMDTKPPDNLDLMNTYLYDPGTPFNSTTADTDPGIPNTSYHVALNQVDFSRFTFVDPEGAPGPSLSDNPMIGPNPLSQIDPTVPPGNTPPVSIEQKFGSNDYTANGTFLFDSGAAASFISQDMAAKVHVHYAPGTYGTDNPVLVDDTGNTIPNQFQIPLGGTGGTITAAGFYLSSLTLQTKEGTPIEFVNAPVLVVDIGLQDNVTGQTITLDGDFGMNYLVASLNLDSGGLGSGSRGTPWDWVTFDQPNGLLGFEPYSGPPTTEGVADAHVFYNNSAFGQTVAPDKQPLWPGQVATFANYTSYTKGLNGVMADVVNIPGPLSLNDFSFKVGNTSDPTTWANAPTPQMTYIAGGGDNGTDRYQFTWADGAIKGEWLQVSLLADSNTGLPADDSFYFGNAPGESGNSPTDAVVNINDVLAARGRQSATSVAIDNNWDYNRDGLITSADVNAARTSQTAGAGALQLVAAPLDTGGVAPTSSATSGGAVNMLTLLPSASSKTASTPTVTPTPTSPSAPTPTSTSPSTPTSTPTATPTTPIVLVPPPPPEPVITTSPTLDPTTQQTIFSQTPVAPPAPKHHGKKPAHPPAHHPKPHHPATHPAAAKPKPHHAATHKLHGLGHVLKK